MKKLLSLALALIMLMSCAALADEGAVDLAATVGSMSLPTPEMPLVDKPMTLKVMFPRQSARQTDPNNQFQTKIIEQLTGIKLEFDVIESAAWSEKLPLAMIGEEYGHIFTTGLDYTTAASYGSQGYFLPLEDLIAQYAPNIQKVLDTVPYVRQNATAPDGHIYAIPGLNGTPRDMLLNLFQELNEPWLDALGIKNPTTLDEFYDMLVAFKTKDPNGNGEADEIPWSFVWNNSAYNMVLGAFGFVDGYHDVIDGKYVYVPAQENYRAYVEFMHKLYAEGLLDAEVFTQTTEMYTSKLQQGIVGFQPNNHYGTVGLENYLKLTNLNPLASEYNNNTPMHPGCMTDFAMMTVTNKCSEEEAIAAVKLADYLYSEEGTMMSKAGPEYGAYGDMIDFGWVREVKEDGTYTYTLKYNKDVYPGYFAARQVNLLFGLPFFYTTAHEACIVGSDPGNNHITTKVMETNMIGARRVGWHSAVTFTDDESIDMANETLMNNFVNRSVAAWIRGDEELTDEAWNAYLEELEALGMSDFADIRQAAYDRWAE